MPYVPDLLDSSVLPIFLLAVLALAVVPGPDLALIVSHALTRGVRAGVWCSVGIAVAGLLQTALVAFGLVHRDLSSRFLSPDGSPRRVTKETTCRSDSW
jgi:threonine/homoserine/homoserine lactone efflux protein